MRDFYIEKIEKDFKSFLIQAKKFCVEKNIKPTLNNFLEYRKEQCQIPECYSIFLGRELPVEFLSSSRKLLKFYSGLPYDFQQDIASHDEIAKARRKVMANPKLNSTVKKLLFKDFC